jgi:Sperm-tail PG-rich repeat
MFGPNSPAYSIGASKREPLAESVIAPGPASYNIARDPITRSVSFNRARKHSRVSSDVPGPGSYRISSNIGSGPHAIITSRKPLHSNSDIPGPADYTPKDSSHSIKYTMATKFTPRALYNIPGPGAYNNEGIGKTSPRATIGKASRLNETIFVTPGPGSYDPKVVKPNVPKFSFPLTPRIDTSDNKAYTINQSSNSGFSARPVTARNGKDSKSADVSNKYKRRNTNSDVPNPDEFNVKGNLNHNNEINTAVKYITPSKQNVPGPGEYTAKDIAVKKKSPSAVFGTSKKSNPITSDVPGPGLYRINRNLKGIKYTFSKQKRYTYKPPEIPGPGQYEIPHTIGTARSFQSLNNTFT